jgi:hypothetical protein
MRLRHFGPKKPLLLACCDFGLRLFLAFRPATTATRYILHPPHHFPFSPPSRSSGSFLMAGIGFTDAEIRALTTSGDEGEKRQRGVRKQRPRPAEAVEQEGGDDKKPVATLKGDPELLQKASLRKPAPASAAEAKATATPAAEAPTQAVSAAAANNSNTASSTSPTTQHSPGNPFTTAAGSSKGNVGDHVHEESSGGSRLWTVPSSSPSSSSCAKA